MRALPLAALAWPCLLLATCHSSEGGGNGPAVALPATCSSPVAGASAAAACAAFVEAAASYGMRCQEDVGSLVSGQFPTYCRAIIGAPGASATAAGLLAACAAKVRALPCGGSDNGLCECEAAFEGVGTLPDGSGCVESLQCSSGFCRGGSRDEKGPKCGQCTARVPVGGKCSGLEVRCVIGASCINGDVCKADLVAHEG